MRLSVVIPCFNGQRVLDAALSTLLNQTTPPHEIIVVDDGSDPAITAPASVRLIRIERDAKYRGSSEAKNVGARHSTGDWLAFTDDDILHMPDAVECVTRTIDDDKTMLTVFSQHVPDGLLRTIGWQPGDSESMECLLECFRKQGKLYKPSDTDSVAPSRNVGPVTALVTDVNRTLVISSEQHFGVISKRFFNSIGGYDDAAFKTWGFNNQDLCLRVLKAGGWIVSNIKRADGEVLHCFHSRITPHDPTEAKADFQAKYGKSYSPFMLLEAGKTCIRKSA